MKTIDEELLEMKNQLESLHPSVRNVVLWNNCREVFIKTYSKKAINRLDSSGFIYTWINNK
jgi:hypothetical protein